MLVATVEHLAYFNTATEQIVPGGLNVGDGQVQALSRARCCLGDVLAEDYRAPGAGRVNWTPRQSSPAVKSASSLHPSLA